MPDLTSVELDNLYLNYGYKLAQGSSSKLRIYKLRYGMYHAAEIVIIDDATDYKKVKKEYSESGYATEIRKFNSLEDAEEALFQGFFIKTPLSKKLSIKYEKFVQRQLKNLPEDSEYHYINSPYDFTLFDQDGSLIDSNSFDGTEGEINIIKRTNELVAKVDGPLFIIIEAAAGFGKTCSAYEILNIFSIEDQNKLPFFTELSRNREARVFKHILHNEVEQQFPNGIKSEVVLKQIKKGRIPLIIDGFDELLSKDLTFTSKDFAKVESMLSTIVDLLEEDAKVIITSRKTAIFKSEEFYNWANSTTNKFSVARFEIKEPTIENWLNRDRLEIIKIADFPLEQLSNPVLLAYLRNVPLEKLRQYFSSSDLNKDEYSIVDRYIEYLLKREQQRQNLKISNEDQLRIYRKLVRFMTEFDFTSEEKSFVKDLIKEYNRKIIIESLNYYSPDEKPSVEDQAETLSNHAFLDRKESGNVGFVNDFILGLLIGQNLILGKYEEYYTNFNEILPQTFSVLAVTAFRVYSRNKQKKLWDIFNNHNFNYDQSFYFNIDLLFNKALNRNYAKLEVKDLEIKRIRFGNDYKLEQVVFSNVIFENCSFDITSFHECSFINCSFYNCSILDNNDEGFTNFQLFRCNDNNGFTDKIYETIERGVDKENNKINEIIILEKFFNVGNITPRHRELSHLRKEFGHSEFKEVSNIISDLESKGFLYLDGDIGHLTKNGISKFHKLNAKK